MSHVHLLIRSHMNTGSQWHRNLHIVWSGQIRGIHRRHISCGLSRLPCRKIFHYHFCGFFFRLYQLRRRHICHGHRCHSMCVLSKPIDIERRWRLQQLQVCSRVYRPRRLRPSVQQRKDCSSQWYEGTIPLCNNVHKWRWRIFEHWRSWGRSNRRQHNCCRRLHNGNKVLAVHCYLGFLSWMRARNIYEEFKHLFISGILQRKQCFLWRSTNLYRSDGQYGHALNGKYHGNYRNRYISCVFDGSLCGKNMVRVVGSLKCRFLDAMHSFCAHAYKSVDAHAHAHVVTTMQACDIGKYKSTMGSQACSNCQAGSLTAGTGSSSQSACLCNAGFETINLQCVACPAGKYKDAADESCQTCPAGTSSTTSGNALASNCLCNAGSTGPGGGPCNPTPAGSWSGSDGVANSCPADSYAPAGSTAVTQCVCNAGYSGPNGGPCTACSAGTYKSITGSASCSNCQYGSSSPSGSTSENDCVLGAGYAGPLGGPYTLCSANTYNTGTATTCSSCPANSQSPAGSTSIAECKCNIGFTGPNGGQCSSCPDGTYKATVGSAPCSASPAGTTCPAGATSAASCPCDPGTSGPGGGPCTTCDVGKYSANGDSCVSCPSNSISPAGSTSDSACQCNVGYTGSAASCTACAVGAYKATTGNVMSSFVRALKHVAIRLRATEWNSSVQIHCHHDNDDSVL